MFYSLDCFYEENIFLSSLRQALFPVPHESTLSKLTLSNHEKESTLL